VSRWGRVRAPGITVSVLLAVAACGAPGGGQGSTAQSGVIKVGVLRPATGTVAAAGQDMQDGWNLFWKQNGTKVAGKTVQSVFEDTAGNPSIALNKATQLVDNQRVDIVAGPLLANVGLAVADALNRKRVPTVLPIVSADDLTQRKRLPYVVRLGGWTSSQTSQPFGQYAAEQGYKTAVTICNDYAFGYETCGGFVNTFTDHGGRILKQLWNPVGTPDFSAYMAQIKQASPDVVFAQQLSADSVRFIKAWHDFGLASGKTVLLGGETLTDQAALRSMGNSADGIVSVGHFAEGRPDPTTRNFVDAYYAAYHRYPSYYSAGMYTAARGIAEAIKALGGNVTDHAKVSDALRKVSLSNTPFGPETMDQYGNPIFNVYIRKVQSGPYGPWNVPIKTYPKVSQFWTYDPKEFLAHPVYSKQYQGNGVWPNPTS